MDSNDRKILNIIRKNSKTTNAEIAKELGMAPSAILERVRKLEKKGVITGYRAQVDPKKIGLSLLAYISVKIEGSSWNEACGNALAEHPHVEEVHEVLGENAYLIKVRVADVDALSELIKNHIATIPSISATNTTVVTKTIKQNTIHTIEL